MLLHCEVCGEDFHFVVENQSFGLTEGTDYNIYHLVCPTPTCETPFIVRVNCEYEKINFGNMMNSEYSQTQSTKEILANHSHKVENTNNGT